MNFVCVVLNFLWKRFLKKFKFLYVCTKIISIYFWLFIYSCNISIRILFQTFNAEKNYQPDSTDFQLLVYRKILYLLDYSFFPISSLSIEGSKVRSFKHPETCYSRIFRWKSIKLLVLLKYVMKLFWYKICTFLLWLQEKLLLPFLLSVDTVNTCIGFKRMSD